MLIAVAPDDTRLFPVAEADLEVRAVAEGLVGGGAAAAERHAVAHLVGKAVGGDHRYPTTQPQRPAHPLRRVLDHTDRLRQRRLDRRAALALPGDEPSGGAVTDLADQIGPYLGVLGALHLVPDLPVGVAEACSGTE